MLNNLSLNAYKQPIQGKRVRVELLDFNFAVLDSIEGVCIGGSLTKDAENILRRSGNIELCVPIDRTAATFLDSVNGYAVSYGGKIWLDKYIKIYIGIDDMVTGETAWQTFGICLMDEPTRDFNAAEYKISFSVIDLMARLTGLRFGQLTSVSTVIEAVVQSGSTYTKTKTREALESVLTELGGIKKYSIYTLPTKYEYLPYDIKTDIGATVWDLLSQFMDILSGWQIFFDDEGVLRIEPIPSGTHNAVYPLQYESLISAKVSTNFQNVKNQVVVYGRTLEPSYVANAAGFSDINFTCNDPSGEFIVGATIISIKLSNLTKMSQTNQVTLQVYNDSTQTTTSYTCSLVDFGGETPYVPAQYLFIDQYYCIRLYSATLNNDGTVDMSQPLTWEWLGAQQVSACRVVDNRESPFYINNQLPNSYWGGMAIPQTALLLVHYDVTIDNPTALTQLRNGTIITFMVSSLSLGGQTLTVYNKEGTQLVDRLPIYDNGAAIGAGKMYADYTIFMVQYNQAGSRFDFLGRHPYVLTKVLSGGVYDNIVADLLAKDRAQYELFLSASLQNNIDIDIVPSFALDVNVKIPFKDSWAVPQEIRGAVGEDEQYFITKTVTYPLDTNGTPQSVNAIQIYTDDNLVGDDYEIPNYTAPQVAKPTISIDGNTLTIGGASNGKSFTLYKIEGFLPQAIVTTTSRTIDLTEYTEPNVTYTFGVIAHAPGYSDSDMSDTVTYLEKPVKGTLITMNVDGTDKQFRVLNVNGNVAEVVGMANASDSIAFGSSQVYAGSTLDTYLNSTWYNTLNSTAQAAIVDKTFTQDSWYANASGDPDYNGYYGPTKPGTTAYTISLGNAAFGSSITRHVYALSVQDVLDYVLDTNITDGQLQNYNIWKMLWNDEKLHTGNNNYPWFRTAYASSSSNAFFVNSSSGRVAIFRISGNYAVRPAFQIDLSKISYTIVT